MTPLGVGRALIGGRLVECDVAIDDRRISEVGLPPSPSGYVAVAGFVDLQVNGFAGADFATATVDGYAEAAAGLAATGVTRFQPTFITLEAEAYGPALAIAAEARLRTPGMIGVHLEGPFISAEKSGAHDRALTRDPDPPALEELLAHEVVTWMTLAPERPGALAAIRSIVATGRVAAIGHSMATADQTRAAFDAGASSVTHLFNAQPPIHHRRPGLVGAALGDPRALLSLIVDGHHVADDLIRVVFSVAGGRVALITDAIAAAGLPDGPSTLGSRTVHVTAGRAELADGTMAGSVVTMDAAIRHCVAAGIPLHLALEAATRTPSHALGAGDQGDLVPGVPADVVVLDDRLEVVRVLRNGAEVHHA